MSKKKTLRGSGPARIYQYQLVLKTRFARRNPNLNALTVSGFYVVEQWDYVAPLQELFESLLNLHDKQKMVLYTEQSDRRTATSTMGRISEGEDEDNDLSVRGGRERYTTPTRVRGNEEPMQIDSDEETDTAGSPGSVSGFQRASNNVLREGGSWIEWRPDEILAYRGAIRRIRDILSRLVGELSELDWGTDEWMYKWDEIEIASNSLETITREFHRY